MSERPNAAAVYIGTLAPGASRRTAHSILNGLARIASGGAITFADEYPWERLRYRQTAALRRELVERYTPRGVNLRLAMLRRVLEEAHGLGQIRADDYQRARRLRNVRGDRGLRGRALTGGEVRALIDACRRDPVRLRGLRDAALLALLFGTGARRLEIAGLTLPEDLDALRGVVTLRTKGNRRREVELLPPIRVALADWLEARGDEPGPLFVAIDREGRRRGKALTPGGIRWVCGRRAEEAGVRDFTPHDLRRSFASSLLDAGVELHVVQEILDHADIATTALYDTGRAARRHSAMERLRVPF